MRITREEFHGLTKLSKKDKKEPTKETTSEPPLSTSTELPPKTKNKTNLSDAEIKKQLSMLAEETMNQLSEENKTLRDVEDIYLIFTGQMMVINKCRLLSVAEQQEQNAQVYACYYKKKFEFKKLELKKTIQNQ